MWRILLYIVGALILISIVWFLFTSFKNAPSSTVSSIFNSDFLSAISQQVTSGLPGNETTRRPQVSLEELGEFSPVAGLVTITQNADTISIDDIHYEYVEIRANKTNAQPINISDWSIQSMVSDVWIGIPQGAELYVAGKVNEVQDIYLRPGERAIIATRASPVGVSFRANRCSGFLSSTQPFQPRLTTTCVVPGDVLPPTIENLRTYGDTCVAFVETLDRCTYVTSTVPDFNTLSQACRDYIQPRLTYNYCQSIHARDSNFYAPQEWRIFLNQNATLWRENYEIVRLLDEENRTVDVFSY